MENKESSRSSKTNVDYDQVRRKLNQGNLQATHEEVKPQKKGPSKIQINRLNYITQLVGYLTPPLQLILENLPLRTMGMGTQIRYTVGCSTETICYLTT